MTGPKRLAVLLAVGAPFALAFTAADGRMPDDGRVVFRFADPDIVESSGLVVTGDRVHTVNDSGDLGRVFTVDAGTGQTTGVTFWADDPDDVEALAPAGPGHVWVADIGDNGHERDEIEVTRVPVGDGDRTVDEETIDLVYPEGQPRDAEALLAHPVTGRLYVVTKGVFAGELLAAPPELADDAPNHLGALGQMPGIVTDGAFFPDGRHLVVRTYTRATVYSFPDLQSRGSWDLPQQEQGEGIAVAGDGSVWLSSEGSEAPVLRVQVPRRVQAAMEEAAPSASPTATPSDAPTTAPRSELSDLGAAGEVDAWPWLLGGLLGVAALFVLVRSLRPH
ncbi:hypothetical protein DDE18_18960 [Nocardioides gansuensis]|uniref:WD40 repeat domain-containing protein n=1 Tax=Nocardioides gansuensis TaxID=2138300 RepID=A0A2T8F6A2_9ACTN|nr:hypothetical protein [Nocardioides gansuensis]PVG81229.1 hypothetical protein DDE18_18960 [Nocardioides gansuensis]